MLLEIFGFGALRQKQLFYWHNPTKIRPNPGYIFKFEYRSTKIEPFTSSAPLKSGGFLKMEVNNFKIMV